MWVPDVYEGAPTPVTAYLSVASKAAGFAVILRIFYEALGPASLDWGMIFAVLAAITMTIGNIVALTQKNIKRMLAYSSIAQAGYIMIGLAAFTAEASSAIMIILAWYVEPRYLPWLWLSASYHLPASHLQRGSWPRFTYSALA